MVLTKEQDKRRKQIKRAEQKAKEAAAPQTSIICAAAGAACAKAPLLGRAAARRVAPRRHGRSQQNLCVDVSTMRARMRARVTEQTSDAI